MKALIFTLATLLSTSAFATTYTFVGEAYQSAGLPFTTEMQIEGRFTEAEPLPADLPFTYIGPGATGPLVVLSWTFTDGAATYDETNSSPYGGEAGGTFQVSTDADGNIEDWNIALISPKEPHEIGQTINLVWFATQFSDNAYFLVAAVNQGTCTLLSDDATCINTDGDQVGYMPEVPAEGGQELVGSWAVDSGVEEHGCSDLTGRMKGLCTAYCEAMNCDEDNPKASDRACERVSDNYIIASDGEMPPCAGEPEPPQQPELCSETCSFTGDGDCDDGGPGAEYSACDLGTDCTDCGVRCPEGMVPDSNNSGFCTFAL